MLALVLLFTAAAHADVCEPLASLSAKANYCDENTAAYVPAAKECFQKYKTLVDAENAKIQGILNKDVKNAKGTQQKADFQTMQTALASALKTLDNLLTQGKQTYNEIDAYNDDMVLPIYDAYPEDYDLDPASHEAQVIFREKECYGEPAEVLDRIKAELSKIITDLEKTKVKTTSLHSLNGGNKVGLDATTTAPAVSGTKGKGSVAPKGGHSKNPAPTITGVEESKKKSVDLKKKP